MRLILPYPPQVNHYYTIARGRKILSGKGRGYKEDVAKLCQVARIKPFEGDVSVTFTAFRPRRIGDLDNVQKPIFDAVKGYAWLDDKQVVEIHAFRSDDKNDPRIEIEISEI